MPYDEFRQRAAAETHVEVAALVVKRFLLVRENRIVRDHFLSLVENEGVGTARMRKIMYGTWVLRDARVQEFVLERIVGPDGRWRPAEVKRKSNAGFFLRYFKEKSAPKIRSNLERFWVEAGIIDPVSGAINLKRNDGWLEEAIRAAAQHQRNSVIRREMAIDPLGYLVRNRLNGIADVSAGDLQAVPATDSVDVEGVFDDEESPRSRATIYDSRLWGRDAPTFTAFRAAIARADPVARERASRAHYELEKGLAEKIRAGGCEAKFNANVDLFFTSTSGSILFEIKSCHVGNFHTQVRRGVSQLLEYEYLYGQGLVEPIQLVLLVETEPPDDRRWLLDFLEELRILLVWRSNDRAAFVTTGFVPRSLNGIVARV